MDREKKKASPVRNCSLIALAEEPWVEIATGRDLKDWDKESQVVYNQARRQSAKRHFYQAAFDFLYANEIEGDYFEFGCHRVRTFRMALTEARHQNMDKMRFLAFDSFEGLPKIENPSEVAVSDYEQGRLATSESEFRRIVAEHGIYTDRIDTFKGFYKDSLNTDLQMRLLSEGRKASLICIDCDLYESAQPVFHFIEAFLQSGTLIYIDDYFVGYKGSPYDGLGKAFNEFQERSTWHFAPFLGVGGFGSSFITCKAL